MLFSAGRRWGLGYHTNEADEFLDVVHADLTRLVEENFNAPEVRAVMPHALMLGHTGNTLAAPRSKPPKFDDAYGT
jgi:cell division septum initiation protein DivIVA